MPFCTNCGRKVADGARFCHSCGAPIEQPRAEEKAGRKTVYEGEVRKCPNCGKVLDTFAATCSACGYEIRNANASNALKEFSEKLSALSSNDQKVSLIQSFPIPNTKEDIFEFIILAASNFDAEQLKGGTKQKLASSWLVKITQCYNKAKLMFHDDSDFQKIQAVYDQTYHKINQAIHQEKKRFVTSLILRTKGLWGGLLIFVVIVIVENLLYAYSDKFYVYNTSIFHLAGAGLMITGASSVGRKSNDSADVAFGVMCGILALLLGLLLPKTYVYGNGSLMRLTGFLTIAIIVLRFWKSYSNGR